MGLYPTNENPVDPPGAPKQPVVIPERDKCKGCKNCTCNTDTNHLTTKEK